MMVKTMIQFALVNASHSSVCTGEYIANSTISNSRGSHFSSTCTRSAVRTSRPFGGVRFSRKRTKSTSAVQRCCSTRRARPVRGASGSSSSAGVCSRETNLALGEETGSSA